MFSLAEIPVDVSVYPRNKKKIILNCIVYDEIASYLEYIVQNFFWKLNVT